MKRLQTRQWIAPAAGGASLLAAVMLTAALFLPFVSQACPGCSSIYTGGLPEATLRDSPDAWAVVWIVGILAATAALFLGGVGVRLMAMASAVASLAALGLVAFEGVVAFPRVLGAAELVPGVPVYYVLGLAYYVFLIGGALALGAAAGMLLVRGEDGNKVPRALASIGGGGVLGWACLAALGLAFAGGFLPFVGLNCGAGCPPFAPPHSSFQGALMGSPDGWIVLTLLAAVAIVTAMRLAGLRRRLPGGTIVLLSLAAAALISFDSLHGATRLLGWPFPIPTRPELGYYLLQAGSAMSVVLSLVLVLADRPTGGPLRRVAPWAPEVTHPA